MSASSTSLQPQVVSIDGLSIRYAESERRGDQDAILMSPWPESVFAFHQVWGQLAEHARLVAIDPPGFGQSDYSEALMSPQAMGGFINRVADHFGLDNPHLVGPDIGTSSCLFAAAARPGRFRTIVVGSGGAAVPLDVQGVLREWIEAPDLEPYRAIDGRDIVTAVLATIEGYAPSAEITEDYQSSYEGERFAESMRYARAYPKDLLILADLLATIETPVRVVQGSKDQVVSAANAHYLADRLPNARADFLDAGHFCWEEKPAEYAALVTDWWKQTR
jgi:pimeloyl-ACP methyl ester carboxylesterase